MAVALRRSRVQFLNAPTEDCWRNMPKRNATQRNATYRMHRMHAAQARTHALHALHARTSAEAIESPIFEGGIDVVGRGIWHFGLFENAAMSSSIIPM